MDTFYRGRRLRRTPELRALVRETAPLSAADLIMPYFVIETEDTHFRKEICAMPGQYQLSPAELEKQVGAAVDTGLAAVILF
ncbi:MAG: porphobilinogen synthase, partial [Desulfovibrionaceae bacterium]|nr:porphobilinogen synthase [Desulfovibrionaceae bacterium]